MKQVLFIGNSYTFYNDMPETIFADMAEEAGLSCRVRSVTRGGYRLCQYLDAENEEGARLRDVIAGKHFDVVVLQEQSTKPMVDTEDFIASVGKMKELLSDVADDFVLYATWGRCEGSPDLETLGTDTETMTDAIDAAYTEAGVRYGMRVAHVGRAFSAYRSEHGGRALYNKDLTHPSYLGSRIAARTILDTILGK